MSVLLDGRPRGRVINPEKMWHATCYWLTKQKMLGTQGVVTLRNVKRHYCGELRKEGATDQAHEKDGGHDDVGRLHSDRRNIHKDGLATFHETSGRSTGMICLAWSST